MACNKLSCLLYTSGVYCVDSLLPGGQSDHDRGVPRPLQLADQFFQLLLQLGTAPTAAEESAP